MGKALGARLFGVVLVVVWFITMAFPQATTSLRGTISDPSGAVIPGAAVTITSADNGTTRKSRGSTAFYRLLPGSTSCWPRSRASQR